jgi:hypothetical protein
MIRSISCAVALTVATFASTSYAGIYQPTKDTFLYNAATFGEPNTTVRGSDATGRVARDVNTAFYLSDFDRAAIESEVRTIIAKPVGALTLGDMAGVEFHWFVKPFQPSQVGLDSLYAPTTLQTASGSGWTESGASDGFFNVATSTQWLNEAGDNTVASIAGAWPQRNNHTGVGNPNEAWGGTADGPQPHRDWLLPDLVEFNFLTSPNAAGLAFIQNTNTSNNLFSFSREAANEADRPFLVVAPIPEPTSLGLLAVGGLALLGRPRRA